MDEVRDGPDLISLTADIVSAFVANNALKGDDVARLIQDTHGALVSLGTTPPEAGVEPDFKPAVTARKSLASRDHIISMIDGKPYKALKRHLTRHGLTPGEYRLRYGLPKDYPMVAPAYSEARRETAVRIGLGNVAKRARAKKAGAAVAAKPLARKRGGPTKQA